MNELLVLGIMSGTSIDSVDYALCGISDEQVRLAAYWQARFPARLRARLHQAACGAARSHEVGQLHHDLGRFYARHAARGGSGVKPQLVGMHGQTIFHQPRKPNAATFQIGEPAWLAEALGVPVISNFRAADLAAGGQGAPLATLFHVRVFGRRGEHVCVQNLGGIGNVTSIQWMESGPARVLAFDTGPANVLMDLAMRELTDGRMAMDARGAWAARGRADERLLAQWLKLPYFRQKPPKSTGREYFGEPFLEKALGQMRRARLSKYDMLATFTAFTAASIALNYRLHLPGVPGKVVLTGGGAANPSLVRAIRSALYPLAPALLLMTSQQLGWPAQSIEPAAFALLASCRHRGRPGNLPGTTGAKRAVLLGQTSESRLKD